jgi:toxin ParE1/3/4
MRRVSIRPEAQADVRTAAGWYEDQVPGLGSRFRAELRACLSRIREHPQAYPLVRGQVRRASLHRFPYLVLYLLEAESAIVLACFHASRDPDWWEQRLPDADNPLPHPD